MEKIYEVKLNKESDIPLYQQLGDSICRLIEDGSTSAKQQTAVYT